MVISRDRWSLDRIATHILAAEGDSKWTFFDGNSNRSWVDIQSALTGQPESGMFSRLPEKFTLYNAPYG